MPNTKIKFADIQKGLDNGLSQSDIARMYGVTRQAISFRLKCKNRIQHEYIVPKVRMRQYLVGFLRRLGFTKMEIAEHLNYSYINVYNVLRRGGFPTGSENYFTTYIAPVRVRKSDYQRANVRILYRMGYTAPYIAMLTNYNYYTVASYIYRMGYTMKGRCL